MNKRKIIAAIKRETGHVVDMHKAEGAWIFCAPLDKPVTEHHVTDDFESKMVCVYALNHLSLEQWVGEFKSKLEAAA